MSAHKHFDKICYVVFAAAFLLFACFIGAGQAGVVEAFHVSGYENRLFNTAAVHSVDIVMDDWDGFLETCANEEYSACTVVIDGEAYRNVAIRAKGNTSLTQVQSYGNDRYSFKIEFDHYDSGTYYGLDKLCLNNIIQDNTYMKDYLTYEMMRELGAAAPLCSYASLSVNGESWGLYLAVEGLEEAFLNRNFGSDYGQLYKPDSMDMGGGRGNGKDFDQKQWDSGEDGKEQPEKAGAGEEFAPSFDRGGENPGEKQDGMPKQGAVPDFAEQPKEDMQSNGAMPDRAGVKSSDMPHAGDKPDRGTVPMSGMPDGGGGMPGGSDDVLLKYVDDDPDSYKNIFDNAKTNASDADKRRLIAALKKLADKTDIPETVDVEQVIRYFVVHNFVLNFDSYTGSMIHNYYLYEKDGQLSMLPWDYNLAFGGFQSAADARSLVNYPIDTPVSGKRVEDRPMLAWIFADRTYNELYHSYFDTFLSQYFESGQFTEMIDATKTLIAPYVEDDPTKFCSYEEFVTGIDTLKEFCLLRAQSIRGQLDGTIGSTSDTQDGETLVDAGDLDVSAMGEMGMQR